MSYHWGEHKRRNRGAVLFLMLALFVWPVGREPEQTSPHAHHGQNISSDAVSIIDSAGNDASHPHEGQNVSSDAAQEAERERQLEALRQQVLAERAARFRPVQLHAPFWRAGEGFRSLLMLNNAQPRRIEITPLVRRESGELLRARTISLGPLQSVDVSLEELIGEASGQGQVALGYVGDPMEVVGQVIVVNEAAGLSFNHVFVPPTMCIAPRFDGVFFWPGQRAQGELILANTSERTRAVELRVYGESGFSARQTFELGPYQTRVMDVREEIVESSTIGATAVGVSIAHNGKPGDLLVQGWVADSSGYAANIRLVDVGMRQSGRVLSPALRLWEGLRPLLLLGNSGDRQQEVSLIAHYRVNGQAVRKSLGRVVVGSGQARAFDLEEKRGEIPRRAEDVGLELQHRGRGENVVADLLLVSEDGSEVISVSPKDAVGEAYGGFNYPWRIGEEADTVIAVMNPSRVEEFYGEESYTYEGGRLRPGEVRQVAVKALRDKRIPDQFGRLLPRGVSRGQAKLVVHGIAGVEESQRIIGEAILVDGRRGIRATMACPNCVSQPLRLEPGVASIRGVVGERASVTARVYYADGSSWAINDGRAIDWLESNVSIVQVVVISDSVRDWFEARFLSPGTATIDAQVNHCWICNPCIDVTLGLTQQIQVTVEPKVQITEADIVSDRIAVLLSPSTASGRLVLTLVSAGGNVTLFNDTRSGGTHVFSFNPANLPARQFTEVRAGWTVNGITGNGNRAVSFRVLGTYRHSQYNTPHESRCVGAPASAYITNAACNFTATMLRSDFIVQVNRNGSGRSINFGDIVREFFCVRPPRNFPSDAPDRSFRQQAIRPACSGLSLSNTTVARNPDHQHLTCGDRVLIVRIGRNPWDS
ncbi:MAG: hypothetical protein NZ746_00440 [Blastocatellia bacterium]|nr:hypothetical protein [Blastocatellia bacterium]